MTEPAQVSVARRSRIWPPPRFWNIALRTAHLAVSGALFGGHVFGQSAERLLMWLYCTLGTGAALGMIEAYPRLSWCYEARGICVLTKLLLIGSILWLWPYRVPILVAVIVIGSVGSHMPRRYRHFSVLHGRELRD